MANSKWRKEKPTKPQLDYIKKLEKTYEIPFTGTTQGEASDYINKTKRHYNPDVENYN